MTLDEFKNYVQEHILDERPELKETAKVTIETIIKNNGKKLSALSIKEEDTSIVPTIYLEYHYQDYVNGKAMEECIEDMLLIYDRFHLPKGMMFDLPLDYEDTKRSIVAKLVNYRMNEELLRDIPYFRYGDLAVTFAISVHSEEMGTGLIRITRDLMKDWNVDEEELLECSLENMQLFDEPEIVGMYLFTDEEGNAYLEEGELPDEITEDLPDKIDAGMYVLTNESKFLGATGLLRLDLIQSFADRAGKNIFIIPSSIHELILVPDFGRVRVDEMRDMVKTVNSTQLKREDILSNNVYYYDRKNHKISVAGSDNPMILQRGERKCS